MIKEQITDKEAICILIVFIMGTNLILGSGGEAKNDAWISLILSLFMFIPMLLIFSRIIALYQGKDLFDILVEIFGNIVGRIISIIYVWYAFHLGALVLRNFGEFINTTAMPETPMFVPLLCLGLVSIFAVRLGIEVLGRTATYFLPVVLFILFSVLALSLTNANFNYFKPIFGNGITTVLKGGFSIFSFPFAETVLFIGVFSALKAKKSPIRVYLWGVFVSAAYFGHIRTLIPGTSGQHNGNIRTA
jgi:spore germination protein KB